MIEVIVMFFFFKQKTAYELRISDWSSDVCSSDLSGSRTSPGDLACRNGSPDTRAAHEDRSIDLAINDCLSSPERDGRIGDVGRGEEIGRASVRARVCQYVYISVVAVSLKKTKIIIDTERVRILD